MTPEEIVSSMSDAEMTEMVDSWGGYMTLAEQEAQLQRYPHWIKLGLVFAHNGPRFIGATGLGQQVYELASKVLELRKRITNA